MKGEALPCCSSARPAKHHGIAGLGTALGLVALLMPKCPMCLMGLLAVFGVGAGASGLAAWVGAWGEPLGWAMLTGGGLWWVMRARSRAAATPRARHRRVVRSPKANAARR